MLLGYDTKQDKKNGKKHPLKQINECDYERIQPEVILDYYEQHFKGLRTASWHGLSSLKNTLAHRSRKRLMSGYSQSEIAES